MFDSSIRLRQLNQSDLSGFLRSSIFPILSGSGFNFTGNHFIPTGSGLSDLGQSAKPFRELYIKEINLPSGSGIWFGQDFFTAYTSGGQAIIQIGSYTITTSGGGISIIGPSGASGIGFSGATGASGISV